MLAIHLLGTPQIVRDGQPLSIARRKSRALLYYLAAQRMALPREQLLTLFWPDHDRASAQQTLRSSVYGLRKQLGEALLITDTTLAIAADVDIDLRHFEAVQHAHHAPREALATALNHYRGEFLANFSLPDCEAFEHWAEVQRERLRQLAVHGYLELAQAYESSRDFVAAHLALVQALSINPLQEELHRAAMRVDYLAGDRSAAIRRYEQLRKLLDDELGVPPLEETRALYDAIITDTLITEPSTPIAAPLRARKAQAGAASLPFIGRDSELERLHILAQKPGLVLIEGEAGIGKTRLAEIFLDSFNGLVLFGRAHELEQALPYHPLIEALRELLQQPFWMQLHVEQRLAQIWRSELARLLPELQANLGPVIVDTTLTGGNEARLWEAVYQLLRVLATGQPVALLIDDLHWADASTLTLLGYLIRQSPPGAIMFLATTRVIAPRTQLATLLQTLTRENRVQRLPLARLDNSATLILARHVSPHYAYPLAEWLQRNADGNPYIVVELLRYAREQGLLLTDGTINLSSLSHMPVVPGSIYSLIQSRLARLSETARHILDVAVAIGEEFDLDVVTQASGLPEIDVLDALDELLAHRLIVALEGLRYRCDHPLTMEVAYREVGEARHRLIHRNVAEALERVYASNLDKYAGLIAAHFAEGHATERATQYAFLAGQRAAELSAWTEAIAFYQQALAVSDEEQRLQVYVALGKAYMFAGAPAQATDELRTAIRLAEQHNAADLADTTRLLLALTLITQARFAEAITIVAHVLEHGAASQRISAEIMWATALSIEGLDLTSAARHLQQAMSQPDTKPSPEQQAQIQFEMGGIAAQQGNLDQALEHYHAALAITQHHPEIIQYRVLALNNLAYHLMLQGQLSGLDYATQGLALAQEHGLIGLQTYLYSTLGEIALDQGQLDLAEQYFNQGLALAERLDIRERIAGINANLGRLAIQRGQIERAIHRLTSAQAQADTLGTSHLAALIRIWLAPLLPLDEAHTVLTQARALAESGGRTRLLEQIEQTMRLRGFP